LPHWIVATRACAYPRVVADGIPQRTKRCVACGGQYFLAFFRPINTKVSRPPNTPQSYRDRCIGCEAQRKREEQAAQRYRRKAKATRDRHAVKLKRDRWIEHCDDLEEMYGWSLDEMVKGIKRVLNEGCPYCLEKVDPTERGLGVITLDIFNPQIPPDYLTNVVWCCAMCNSEKHKTSPEVWGARLSMWGRWRQHQRRVDDSPEEYGLFDWRVREEQGRLFP